MPFHGFRKGRILYIECLFLLGEHVVHFLYTRMYSVYQMSTGTGTCAQSECVTLHVLYVVQSVRDGVIAVHVRWNSAQL